MLEQIFGTRDLGALQRHAFEVGTREKALENQRLRSARGTLAVPAWTLIGPVTRPNQGYTAENANESSGMIANIAIHPTDPRTIWAGTSGGGVWKSTDLGATWTPTTDSQLILPIGAVAVAPSNPNRVYAGSGCGDESSSSQDFAGFGLLISNDGGATWRASQTSPGAKFFELLVDPANADIVLAATNRGVMRSTNGGDTWANSLPSNLPAVSLSRASNPAIVFAGTWQASTSPGSIWKSTDGGASFTEKASGLPGTASTRARAEVAVAPSDPTRVYALFADNQGSGNTLDMVVSADGGDTWTALNLLSKNPNVTILGTQGNAFSTVAVDPQQPNTVYAGGLDMWKTTDAGANWARISNWQGPTPDIAYMHADHHSINFASDGSIVFSNDGGIFRSTNGGRTFQSLNRGLATMQFYYICQTAANATLVMAGAQDNGTSLRTQGSEFVEPGIGGDGFGCFIDGANAQNIVGSAQNLSLSRSTDGGRNFGGSHTNFGLTDGNSSAESTPGSKFNTIVRPHPTQPDTAFIAAKRKIWRTQNGGASWTPTSPDISSVSEIGDFNVLPTDGSRIVLVTTESAVLETPDAGATWSQKGTIPANSVNAIRYDRTNLNTIYASSTDTRTGQSLARVMRSTDGGSTWAGAASGLPDVPVHTIHQDVRDASTWYAGTYIGVYVSTNGGGAWTRLGTGLPNVMVFDMLQQADGKLRAGTFGRGIWEIDPAAGPPAPEMLLAGDRVAVSVTWRNPGNNTSGNATPVKQLDQYGYFWFTDAGNPEVFVKVLDFGGPSFLAFHAALSDLEYTVTYRVVASGKSYVFKRPAGSVCGLADGSTVSKTSRPTGSAYLIGDGDPVEVTVTSVPVPAATGSAVPAARSALAGNEMLLAGDRVAVSLTWRNPGNSTSGNGTPVKQLDQYGYFWFTDAGNPEVFVKVLDFGGPNFLVFHAALSDLEYTVTFRVVSGGQTYPYFRPAGSVCGAADGGTVKK